MKITALKKQIRNPDRVNIFVDGKFSFSLTLDELVKEKITNNLELNEQDLKYLKKLSVDGKLKMQTLSWLLGRPHSTSELETYLRRKKADPELIDLWRQEFTDKQYLNDQHFAQWLAELRQKKGRSNRMITSELYKKGINREIIDELQLNSNDQTERLRQLIDKKRRLTRYAQDENKLIEYLLRQGFQYQDIRSILKN